MHMRLYIVMLNQPHTGCVAVMRRDSYVAFSATYLVCLCVYLTLFLTFLHLSFLISLYFISYLFTFLLLDLFIACMEQQ